MRQNYLKNAALLTGSNLLLRLAGMAFRIYLANALGDEGLGLYQLILALYSVFITLATSGVSVAATRLVTEELSKSLAQARGMIRHLAAAALGLGCAAGAVQYALADTAARWWLGDLRAAASLRTLAFSLPFMALAAVLRGAFVALRRVEPNVISQIVEQGFRISVVLVLLQRWAGPDIAGRCNAVLLGETLSEALSTGLMLLFYRGECRRSLRADRPRRPAQAARRIWEILWPVEGGRCLSSGLRTAENMLVPACLSVYLGQEGGGRTEALAQYGTLKGMAMPLLSFPFSLLNSLATLLMPEITEAHIHGRRETLCALLDRMITLTMYASVAAAAVFYMWAEPLAQLLYRSTETGFYIRVLAPIMPLMYLESMVDGAIKGLGEQKAAFGYTAWDSVLRIAGVIGLLPRCGMQGFLLVMILSNLFTCMMNARRLILVTGLRVQAVRWFLAPCAAAAPAALAARWMQTALAGWPLPARLLAGCAVMALAYLAAAWPLGLGQAVAGALRRPGRKGKPAGPDRTQKI